MLCVFGSRWCSLGARSLRSYGLELFHPRRLAGHSHWQNVRHTKEAKDKIKSALAQQYRYRVLSAIKVGGGIRDPKLNSHLADVLAEAKANSVPLATLEKAIKADNTTDPYVIEVQATGGLFILIESRAKAASGERQRLKSIVRKYGCTIPSSIGKISSEFFDHVGLVSVKGGSDTKLTSLDAATELGIEVGATEVEELSEDNEITYQFYCDPLDLNNLVQKLQGDHAIPILSATDKYIPKSQVLVTPDTYANLTEMYARIRELFEHVDRIFDNVSVSDDGT